MPFEFGGRSWRKRLEYGVRFVNATSSDEVAIPNNARGNCEGANLR
jgi:hypothetical protein